MLANGTDSYYKKYTCAAAMRTGQPRDGAITTASRAVKSQRRTLFFGKFCFRALSKCHQNRTQFSVEDDAKFAHLVSNHPCIFDLKNGFHKNQGVRENVWTEISSELKKW